MAKKKQILYPVVFMILITVAFTFLLSFINQITQPTIQDQEAVLIKKSVLYAFGIDLVDKDEINNFFDERIQIDQVNDRNIYTYRDKDLVGYAFDFAGKGLWGTISGHIAISPDHQEILGLNFISHQETPGLGGRIDESDFKDQFKSLKYDINNIIVLNKATGGNVDAISGATLTSLAVKDIINQALPEIIEFAKKEGFYEGN